MAEQLILPRRIVDGNGDPISGANVYAYIEGTSTLEVIYADEALSAAHPSPLLTNAEGTLDAIWHAGDHGVKIRAYDASGVELDWSPLNPAPMTSSATTAANITFTPTTNNPASDVQEAIENASNLGRTVSSKAANYTAILSDRASLIRGTANLTISSSAAATLGNGWFVELIADGGDITVAPAGGSTIGILKDGSGGTLVCSGTTFYLRRNTFLRGTGGDITYCDSNGDLSLLPKGTASQVVAMNSGATAPEWVTAPVGFAPNAEWRDKSGSRSGGNTYQNTTGYMIQVSIWMSAATGKDAEVSTDNFSTSTVVGRVPGTNALMNVSFNVPDGHYYKIGGAITGWAELSNEP